jgi:phosphate transport system substrate-binding protein
LPDQAITVVHRSDGSGTTYIWADYLAKVSPEWKSGVGVASELKWPTGVGEIGNDGVASKVQKTPGSIGYVELAYAYRFDLAFGLVQNREKEFVKANLSSVTKAGDQAEGAIPDDAHFSLTDAPGKGSYPIVGTTWAILFARQPRNKGHQLADFLTWATGPGQERVQELFYARLPDALAEKAKQRIAQIRN